MSFTYICSCGGRGCDACNWYAARARRATELHSGDSRAAQLVAELRSQLAEVTKERDELRGIQSAAEMIPLSEWASVLAAAQENVRATAMLLVEAEVELTKLREVLSKNLAELKRLTE